MGELGWTFHRWERSTFTEFNYAVEGYWRTWERFAAVPMREICYTQIAGNPNIRQKPKSSREFMPLNIDKGAEIVEGVTAEEIKKVQERFKRQINGEEI